MFSLIPTLNRSLILFCSSLLLLTAPAAAQSAGGESTLLHQWDGSAAFDFAGYSVADAGDVNADGFDDIIVGAREGDLWNPGNGAAYVYSGLNGAVLHQWDGYTVADEFGYSVSSAGDVNGDGFADLIVGSPHDSHVGVFGLGAVYVYSGATGSELYHWYGSVGNHIGYAVSDAGDVNNDGFDDFIFGARDAAPGGLIGAGSAYVHSGFDGALLYQWDGVAAGDQFGYSVSSAGDTNNDGFADLIVGATQASLAGSPNPGTAFVYSGATGLPLLQLGGSATGNAFGAAVSDAGDINGDGYADILVSEPHASPFGTNATGSAYAISGINGALLYRWNGTSDLTFFGTSLSGAGDVNADGFDDILVGTPWTSHFGLNASGVCYLYSGADGGMLEQWNGASPGDHFGTSVAGGGDTNGDGIPDIIVGAAEADSNGLSFSGSAYVYEFDTFLHANTHSISASTGGAINLELNFPSAAANDQYRVLISRSGPGYLFFGVGIPLQGDPFVTDTYSGNYHILASTNLHGVLDANGNATAVASLLPGTANHLIGHRFWAAAIAHPMAAAPEHSSSALVFEITP